MTRKERLMKTIRGEAVDRPPVCFYDLDGYRQDETNPDPFNVYNDPSWRPLLKMAREKTDRIILHGVPFIREPGELDRRRETSDYYDENGHHHYVMQIHADGRVLTHHGRRDKEVDTYWTLEHWVKDEDDLRAWMKLMDDEIGEPDYTQALKIEEELGDTGILCIDTGDALCEAAELMDMEDYMVMAMMEQELFTELLDKIQKRLLARVSRVAKDMPGRLWRICGPEYATPPYLPPYLYEKYVTKYDKELVDVIKKHGGYPRIHQHGRGKDILDYTAQTGCIGIDPIEPAPQGDVTLSYVREKYGKQFVLFGNLECSDIENMKPEDFREKVRQALREGTQGEGRGFVLMPSAMPLGRKITDKTLRNYEIIIEETEAFGC